MKPAFGFLAALASCAAAAQPVANVFILPRPDASSMTTTTTTTTTKTTTNSTTPSLPRSLTRLLLLQRLALPGRGLLLAQNAPSGIDSEQVVSALNSFGKTLPPLFGDDQPEEEPRQLVLMMEGMTKQQIRDAETSLKMQPSFTISNPPSAGAHEKLARYDFYNAGVTKEHKCGIERVTNPFDEDCWSGKSTVARYNVGKDSKLLDELTDRISLLESLADKGEMETTILLLPVVSESSASKSWSDKPQQLRRRQMDAAEQVITSFGETPPHAMPTSSLSDNGGLFRPRGPIPSCFGTLESCVTGTGNCSHQGECVDRYAAMGVKEHEQVCFSCHCMSTRKTEHGPLTHWAGPTCAKKDVSVPFWLFAGFTILMVGTLSMATSLLYSIGNEKLPGVIGAGVAKK